MYIKVNALQKNACHILGVRAKTTPGKVRVADIGFGGYAVAAFGKKESSASERLAAANRRDTLFQGSDFRGVCKRLPKRVFAGEAFGKSLGGSAREAVGKIQSICRKSIESPLNLCGTSAKHLRNTCEASQGHWSLFTCGTPLKASVDGLFAYCIPNECAATLYNKYIYVCIFVFKPWENKYLCKKQNLLKRLLSAF